MAFDRERLENSKMEARFEQWSGGSMIMAVLVALLVGIFIGAMLL